MQQLRSVWQEPTVWPVPLRLPGVLHQAGFEHQAQQGGSSRDAGSYCEVPRQPWPGADLGVRRPDPDETPLSASECWVAVREGLT
jgi:hypothetical protein